MLNFYREYSPFHLKTMKELSLSKLSPIIIFVVLLQLTGNVKAQTSMPETLDSGTIRDQLEYLEKRTRIYEDYRAVREDMFQKVKRNVTDSLRATERKIASLSTTVVTLNSRIDSLENSLHTTQTNLDEMSSTKNSIQVLGFNVNKLTYNSIIWTIIAGLILALMLGFVVFKRNQVVTENTQKELRDVRDEFEEYRKTTRIAREKMTMDHFNEMKRLKGG